MADVFLSYKSEDRPRILPLVRALEALGYSVWWDLELIAGQKWSKHIRAELDAALCVVVVWTRLSVMDDGDYASDWVEIEADHAVSRGVLVPAMFDQGRVAFSHQKIQYADLVSWKGQIEHKGFTELLKGIARHAGPRVRPDDLERAAWGEAERANMAGSYSSFLAAYPKSRFAAIARDRAAELGEADAWNALGPAPDVLALSDFLRQFPAGQFADEAEALIDALGASTLPPLRANLDFLASPTPSLASKVTNAIRDSNANQSSRIYVSYAWGDDPTPEGREREVLVDRLCEAARERGLTILRDRTALRTGDSIDGFMRRIGAGDKIFVFLSDKYLRSTFCMFELSEIWRNGRHEGPAFMDRVKLYSLSDAKYRTPADWIRWAVYWREQHDNLAKHARANLDLGVRSVFERMDRIQKFYPQVTEMLALLADRVSARDFEDFKRFGFDESPRPTPWASERGEDDFGLFARITVGGASQAMRWIPPGTFWMGSAGDEPGRISGEGPRHRVTLSSGFWLFDTPCTQALWVAVMGENPSMFKGPDYPVEGVSWTDARRFIARINSRVSGLNLTLPTEAQWEYACRAGTGTATYAGPMSDWHVDIARALEPIAWHGENSGGTTHRVRLKAPNGLGLYDMLGNVWEWCADGMRAYGADPVVDPVGPTTGESGRVIRGGSWLGLMRDVRAAYRGSTDPENRGASHGFRCAQVEG